MSRAEQLRARAGAIQARDGGAIGLLDPDADAALALLDHALHAARAADPLDVTTPPLKGLGVDMDLIERIVGTDDPDLLRLLRDAQHGGAGGRPPLGKTSLESNGVSQGESSSYTVAQDAVSAPQPAYSVGAGTAGGPGRASTAAAAADDRTCV